MFEGEGKAIQGITNSNDNNMIDLNSFHRSSNDGPVKFILQNRK